MLLPLVHEHVLAVSSFLMISQNQGRFQYHMGQPFPLVLLTEHWLGVTFVPVQAVLYRNTPEVRYTRQPEVLQVLVETAAYCHCFVRMLHLQVLVVRIPLFIVNFIVVVVVVIILENS